MSLPKLTVILLLAMAISTGNGLRAQPTDIIPLTHFGYADSAESQPAITETSSFTDFATTPGICYSCPDSLVTRLTNLHAANVLAIVDLSNVLFCASPCLPYPQPNGTTWRLRTGT